jgi:hypothetical protein
MLAERVAQRSNTMSSQASQPQGVFSQLSQGLSERTAKLGSIQDTFSSLEQASSEWYNSVAKTAEKEKNKAMFGSLTGINKFNPF